MQKGTRVKVRSDLQSVFAGEFGTAVEATDDFGFTQVDLDNHPEWKGDPTPFSRNELVEVA